MKRLILIVILIAISIFSGCETNLSLLPEDIIENALKASNSNSSYYTEYKILVYDKNEIISNNLVKEWFKPKDKKRTEMEDEKGKLETVLTIFKNEMIVYSVNEKNAMISKDPNINDFAVKSQKDKVLEELKFYKKTHNITLKGMEKINNMETYHIVAVPKDNNTLLGKAELWIHKDYWFIVKSISESADTRVETLYSKIDMNVDIKDDIFKLKLPDDVKVENMEDMENSIKEKEITYEEALKALGKPFLKYNGNDYNLKNITIFESKDFGDEINFYYEKDGLSAFDITAKADILSEEDKSGLSLGKKIKIRNKEGYVVDGEIKVLAWNEDGINYSMIVNNPRISVEEAQKILMKFAVD